MVCPSPQLEHLDSGMVGRDKNQDTVKEEEETEEVLEGQAESTPIASPSLFTLREECPPLPRLYNPTMAPYSLHLKDEIVLSSEHKVVLILAVTLYPSIPCTFPS